MTMTPPLNAHYRGLPPAKLARTDAQLDKQFRFSNHGGEGTTVRTLREQLTLESSAGMLTAKCMSDNSCSWNRHKFNRMNCDEQAEYEARLKKGRSYWVCITTVNPAHPDVPLEYQRKVSKLVYDVLDLPPHERSLDHPSASAVGEYA